MNSSLQASWSAGTGQAAGSGSLYAIPRLLRHLVLVDDLTLSILQEDLFEGIRTGVLKKHQNPEVLH